MSYHVRLFHLVLQVPRGTKRARSLCGYSLRQGARFNTLKAHGLDLRAKLRPAPLIPPRIGAYIRARNSNALQAFNREDYWENLCPECLEHPEYVLTLLADLP